MKTIDITSRLEQFAWRQITPSTIQLPVIFRHDNREEYLCVQMIKIHLLSKYSSELISYSMKQIPIEYFSLTKFEGKLFQLINQFHSNGYLGKSNQLDYTKLDSIYITPFIKFIKFYEFISSNNNTLNNCLSTKSSSSNSYCRSINFHEKEIMSYSSTSIINSNKTILCLSIKDIISIYFPCTTIKKFIRLCRLKQIIRYKPEKSTNSDLSLKLINIQQLEQYWQFFIQQLSPNLQSTSISHSNENSSVNNSLSSLISFEHENLSCQVDTVKLIDDKQIHLEIDSLLKQLIQIIEQNELIILTDSTKNQDEQTILSTIENKTMKRKRRRSQKCFFTLKRRKHKLSNHQIQSWMSKYSIEPISILLDRVNIPID